MMKKLIIAALTVLASVAGTSAQGFFDDKVFDKPVPHKSSYDNDFWHLKSISRTGSYTEVVLEYTDPFRNAGSWTQMALDDMLIDQATGKKYPLMLSSGIPRYPHRYTWQEITNDIRMTVSLYYPPLPESVKTVKWGPLYDIELGNVPVKQEGITRFFHDKKNKDGCAELLAVYDDGTYTMLVFGVTSNGYDYKAFYNPSHMALRDKATGKTLAPIGCGGLPEYPETMVVGRGETVGFYVSFPSIRAQGIEAVDFDYDNWSIQSISIH